MQKCGTVAIVGSPNAGKSTLINTLVGAKVSIVSSKVQTTRSLVRGIAIYDQTQIIFVDTPGIFKPKLKLERAMVSAAWQGQEEADIIAVIVDASKKHIDKETEHILSKFSHRTDRKYVLVLNKIDQCKKDILLKLAETLNSKLEFDATFMISALKKHGADSLLKYFSKELSECEWIYPEDQISDMPLRLLAAEITREKCFKKLHQELPYGIAVETEGWEDFKDGSIKIDQVIYVMRDSHKGIVLGKGGEKIKSIGEMARKELEEIIDERVHLKLFVKVQENWTEDPEKFLIWGLDHRA